MEIILPLLRTNSTENNLLNENPEDFVTLALDTCEKQVWKS